MYIFHFYNANVILGKLPKCLGTWRKVVVFFSFFSNVILAATPFIMLWRLNNVITITGVFSFSC
jgi:hypothetical protein